MPSVGPKLQGILGNGAFFFLQSMRSLVCTHKDPLQILPQAGQSGDETGEIGRKRTDPKPPLPASRCCSELVFKAKHFRNSTPGSPYCFFWIVDPAVCGATWSITLVCVPCLGIVGGGSCVPSLGRKARVSPLPFRDSPASPGWCLPDSGKTSK